MKNKIKNILILFCLVFVLILPYFVFAQAPIDKLKIIQPGSGYAEIQTGQNEMIFNIGKIIKVFLSLLGVIFLILMLYAGYNWMTASGDEAKVSKAKDTITRAIIGLIITVGAYGISSFVINRLLE